MPHEAMREFTAHDLVPAVATLLRIMGETAIFFSLPEGPIPLYYERTLEFFSRSKI